MFLIGASAVVMYTYRAAFVDDQLWAKIASLVISIAGGCFLVYAALFFVANMFTTSTAPIRHALDRRPETSGDNPATPASSPFTGGDA